MFIHLNIFFLFVFEIVNVFSSSQNESRRGLRNDIRIIPTVGEVWPKPQSIQMSQQQLSISSERFRFFNK